MRAGAGAVCLALALAAAAVTAQRFAADHPQGKFLSTYSHFGEILAHSIAAKASVASYRMPMATLVSARVHHHTAASYGALIAANSMAVVLLVVALGLLLHPYGAFIAGLALAILARSEHDRNLYPETGYYLLILLTAGLLVWRARAPSPRRSAMLASAIGASLIWRSPLAFFGPALALYEWAAEHRGSFKSYRKQFLILCIVPYLFLLPWIAMNWTIHRQIVIFEKSAANSNIVTGALGLVQNIEGDLNTLVDEPIDTKNTGAVVGWAAGQVLRHPLRFARAYILRMKYALAIHPWLVLFGVAGLWAFRKRREYRELALMAAYFLAIHCCMTVEERYFWPVWPLVALLACSLPAALRAGEQAPGRLEGRFAGAVLTGGLGVALALSLYTHWTLLSFASLVRQGKGDLETQLSAALGRHPDDTWLLSERGNLRFGRGDFSSAAGDFSRAAALEPDNPRLQLDQARSEALAGKDDRLLAWEDASESGPREIKLRIDVEIMKACAHISKGRKGEALRHLRTAREAFAGQNIVVRGPQGELEKKVLDKIRASDTGFVGYCRQLQGPRPAAEKSMLNDLLAELDPDSSELWIGRSELAAQTGRREEAVKALARAVALKLRPVEQVRVAAVYLALKDSPRAFALIEALTQSLPHDPEVWILRAEIEASGGARAAALGSLARGEALALNDGQTRRSMALHLQLKEHARAFELLEDILKRSPTDAGLWLMRAELAVELGRRDSALESLAKAEELRADAEGQPRRVMAQYRKLNEPRRASAYIETMTRQQPLDAGLWITRAELAAQTGDPAAAAAALDRAVALKPAAPDLLRIAVVYGGLKEFRRALTLSESLISALPANPEAWILRAEAAAELGEPATIPESVGRAEALSLSDDQTRRVAVLHRKIRNNGRAAELIEALLKRAPASPELLIERAELAAEMGDRPAALAHLSRSAPLALNDGQCRRSMALHLRFSNRARALELLDEIIRRSPASPELHIERAGLAAEMGRRDEALASLARAEELRADAADQPRRVTALYRALNELPRAAAYIEAATLRRPREAGLWITRAEIAAQTGDRAGAATALDRALALKPAAADLLRIVIVYAGLKEFRRSFAVSESLIKSLPQDAESWIARAEAAAELGERTAALESLSRGESLNRSDEQTRRVAVLHRKMKNHARAAELIDGLLARSPMNADLLLERAGVAADIGETATAVAHTASAETLALNDAQSRLVVALRAKSKTTGRAPELLAGLLRRHPTDAGLRIDQARLAAQSGDRDAALKALAQAEVLGSASEEANRQIAGLYRDLKEGPRAYAVLEALGRRRPGDADLLIERAELADQNGDRGAALRVLAGADELTPLSAAQRSAVVNQYRRLREPRRGLRFLAAQAKLGPADAAALLDQAELALESGEPEAAREALALADSLKPGDGELLRIAVAYAALRDDRRAFGLLDALAARMPSDAGLWIQRAELESRTGARDAALKSLGRAEALSPGEDSGGDEKRLRIAFAYQGLKEYDRAIGIFTDLTRRHPAVAAHYSDKALCEHLKGADDAALADLRTAIGLEPKFMPAYLTLSFIHATRGRPEDALKVYDEALSKTDAADADPLRETVLAARKELLAKSAR